MIELYLSSEVSYQELALQKGINNPAMLVKWVNAFRIAGPDALRPKKKRRKKTVSSTNHLKNISSKEKVSIDTSTEHIKTKNRECLFKRTEEVAFRRGSPSEKTARIIRSPRGEFKLKDILAVAGFPKMTYMY